MFSTEVRKGLNGLLVRPMLGDESTGSARAGVADRRRKGNQGKLVVHAGRRDLERNSPRASSSEANSGEVTTQVKLALLRIHLYV